MGPLSSRFVASVANFYIANKKAGSSANFMFAGETGAVYFLPCISSIFLAAKASYHIPGIPRVTCDGNGQFSDFRLVSICYRH